MYHSFPVIHVPISAQRQVQKQTLPYGVALPTGPAACFGESIRYHGQDTGHETSQTSQGASGQPVEFVAQSWKGDQ